MADHENEMIFGQLGVGILEAIRQRHGAHLENLGGVHGAQSWQSHSDNILSCFVLEVIVYYLVN
jgi:hypothetical protein